MIHAHGPLRIQQDDMTTTYEGMFLVDNDLVRADWAGTKSMVTGLLEKHGATIRSARRWDERALAYPIKGRRRGTYILVYSDMPGGNIEALKRELEITDGVLRYLILRAEEVPAEETELAQAETSADFELPAVPDDDEGEYAPVQNVSEEDAEEDEGEGESKDEAKSDSEKKDEPVKAAAGASGEEANN